MGLPFSNSRPLAEVVENLDRLLAEPAKFLQQHEVRIGCVRPYRTALTCLILLLGFGGLLFVEEMPPALALAGMGIMAAALAYLLWPTRRELVLYPSGVEFIHGASTVWCPWALFSSTGQPLLVSTEDTSPPLLVPIAANGISAVEQRLHGALVTTGRDVRTPAFRFHSPHEVLLTIYYRANPAELGELLLILGQRLGAPAPETVTAESAEAYVVVEDEPAPRPVPTRERGGWFTMPITQLQFLPYCCSCGSPTSETYAWTTAAKMNAKDLGMNIVLSQVGGFERNLTFPLPFCGACRRKYRRRYVVAGALIAAFALCLVPALASRHLGPLELALGVVGLVCAIAGFEFANHFPVRVAYDAVKHTISFKFDKAEVGERMLGG